MLPCAHPAADLEVLYWKQMKERVAAQRKLQPRVSGAGGGALGWGAPPLYPRGEGSDLLPAGATAARGGAGAAGGGARG